MSVVETSTPATRGTRAEQRMERPAPRGTRRRVVLGLLALVLVAVLALLPQLQLSVPGVLPGPTYSAGTLQLLANCLLIGALAVTYNLLFGVTGMLSFGHALYFAVGVYGLAIALEELKLGLFPAILLTLAVGIVVAVLVGAVSLRVDGISFAMVTLAFAQAGSLLVYRNLGGHTGGEEGLGLDASSLPSSLLGVANTAKLYWIALAVTVVVFVAVAWVSASRAGALMHAVRENRLRVEVLGARPYLVRLIAFGVSGTLATVVGMAYLLVQGGADPQITTSSFTLSLLVMVVLGGLGARWGAVVGGIVYTLLDQRLASLASSSSVASLPDPLRVPLSQPTFLLGVLFVLVVMFLPGGLAGAFGTLTRSGRPGPRETLAELSTEETR